MPSNKMRIIEAYLRVSQEIQEGLDAGAFGDLRSALSRGPDHAGDVVDALVRLKRSSPEDYWEAVVPYVMREIDYIEDYAQDVVDPIAKEVMGAVDATITGLLKRLMKGRQRDSDESYEAVLDDLEDLRDTDDSIVRGAIEDVLHGSGVFMMDHLLDISYNMEQLILGYDDLDSLADDAVFHDPEYEVRRVRGFEGALKTELQDKVETRFRRLLER